jgi:hypothetical protein
VQAPLQKAKPEAHSHLLLLQKVPVGHFWPQVPQLLLSTLVLTQPPEQLVGVLAGQEIVQVPLEQTSPDLQTMPHLPQWRWLPFGSTQRPLQSNWPGAQEHFPETQEVPPLHLFPQVPQLSLLVLVSTQPPEQVVGVLEGQEILQEPLEQSCPERH